MGSNWGGGYRSDRQNMEDYDRQKRREDTLKDQVGKLCPECKRRLVGYVSKAGRFGLYCLFKMNEFDDRNRPGYKTARALLGFSSHQPTEDGKDGFWTDASKVEFGPDGPPPREQWAGMRSPTQQRREQHQGGRTYPTQGPPPGEDTGGELPF